MKPMILHIGGYVIEQKGPEGWRVAFVVKWSGKEVASFSYKDNAKYYAESDVMGRNKVVPNDQDWRSMAQPVPKQPDITAPRPILELIKRFSKSLTGPHSS